MATTRDSDGGRAEATRLLRELSGGNPGATEDLFPIVYDQLRALAAAYFRDERPGTACSRPRWCTRPTSG